MGQFNEIICFYEEGLGLKWIGEFLQYNGYDGVMFGFFYVDYYLEFIQYEGESIVFVFYFDSFFVFYVLNVDKLIVIILKLKYMGY